MNVLLLLGVVVMLLLAGCGGSGSHSQSPQPTTVTHLTASVTLKHMPQGSTLLNWNPSNHVLTVNVRLTGLAPNSTHPAHIHQGSCSSQGSVLYPLQNLVADAHGVADSTTTIKNVDGIPGSGWYVNVHNGPGLSTPDESLPIVCGNIANPAPSDKNSIQQITVSMISAPSSSANQNAHGTVKMTLVNGALTVTMSIYGLQPGSSHAAHIHSGSCASQGPVVYPLKTVVADPVGNALLVTVVKNVKTIPASGWYVNVHRTTDLSTQTGFDPIACGDVQVTS